MFFNPITGQRRVSNRDSRSRVDWAEEVRQLLDVDYPQAKKIKLACDNLNTHSIAKLYEAFPAPRLIVYDNDWKFTTHHAMAVGWTLPKSNCQFCRGNAWIVELAALMN